MDALDLLVALAMMIGLVGILIPFLPGLSLILVATLVWVLADGADPGQWIVFGSIAVLTVGAMVLANVIPARRATAVGAPWWVLGAGAVGIVIGFLTIPVIGALVGGPAGIFAAELVRQRDGRAAWATTRAALRGVGVGVAIQMVAGVLAVAIWAVAAIRW
jgi:uncharacterized protein YqgC (DUF456 family)